MDRTSYVAPIQLSRKQIDEKTVQARYKSGYCIVTVNSRFSEGTKIADLYYRIIQKKHGIQYKQHEKRTQANPTMVE